MPILENLTCPIDGEYLQRQAGSLTCSQGHTFDLAKTGYVNLLPVQHKRSKDPGDSKEMVSSRQHFLNLHHYFPIIDAIMDGWPKAAWQPNMRILDAGCGEGYYLDQLGRAFEKVAMPAERVGLDISKWAVTAASKRDKAVSWIVASNASLPVPDQRFDIILCLFGFPVFHEFQRVLTKSGYLLLVESGPEHLIELREILYDSIHTYKATHADGVPGFELYSEHNKRFHFSLLSQQQIQDLLSMTPHIHKASYRGKQEIKQLDKISVTADIKLRWYRKTDERST